MSRFPFRKFGVPLILLCVLFVLTGETCGKTEEGCRAEPVGYVNVFFRSLDGTYPRSMTATVVSIDAAARTVALADSSGAADTLYIDIPGGGDLPLDAGRTYTFDVDYAPGFPSLSGVLIRDSEGLLFAGITDREMSPRIFSSGVPGLAISLAASDCPDRNDDPCYDAIHNAVLSIRNDTQTVALKNSEAARLGDYDITCLAAQRVDYNSSCADAGVPSWSFILVRHDSVTKSGPE